MAHGGRVPRVPRGGYAPGFCTVSRKGEPHKTLQ